MAQRTPEELGLGEFSPDNSDKALQYLQVYYTKLIQSGATVNGGTSGSQAVGGIQDDDTAVSGNRPVLTGGVTADPAALPADTVAGRVKRFLTNLKGILLTVQANLIHTSDTVGSIGKAVATDSGITPYRSGSAGVTNTAVAIKAAAGSVFDVRVINPNAAIEYLKFFNVAAASVVVGTTVPVFTVPIPASSFVTMSNEIRAQFEFTTAIAIFCTSVLADTGAQTAPAVALPVELGYV